MEKVTIVLTFSLAESMIDLYLSKIRAGMKTLQVGVDGGKSRRRTENQSSEGCGKRRERARVTNLHVTIDGLYARK